MAETLQVEGDEYDLITMQKHAAKIMAAAGSTATEQGLSHAVIHLVDEVLELREKVTRLSGG